MNNMLQTGMQWLSDRLKASASQTVTYRRGDLAATISATLGSVLLRIGDGRGNTRVERTDRDFIFPAADLSAGADGNDVIDMPPQRGDVIDVTLGATTERYQLLPYGPDEPLWRWLDSYGIDVRVHGKYAGTV